MKNITKQMIKKKNKEEYQKQKIKMKNGKRNIKKIKTLIK